MKKIIVIFFCLISTNCFCQTLGDLNKLDSNAQQCADTTTNFVACENLHYAQMDSILNATYRKLKIKRSAKEFEKIKESQIKWLTIRNKQFKEIENSNDCNTDPDICKALLISKKTWVVRKRLEYLISLLK
ncbi:lysozyme inhibitor LprI family protein [Ferruginibacter albus]|uniref:lysozyme inhibitor LprI family protein n=1 Tax=Ferruginibacter albus TaxID=2875540 RepID=UPI001CC3CB15|nr:lysozyme inhibitor LprI family protein [Ferruginibacter albus]UAY53256.1 DUF1311 domain-containing protein [Ferruginibacter albus]